MKVIRCKFHPLCHEFYLKFPKRRLGSQEVQSCGATALLRGRDTALPTTHSLCWEACWARQERCPLFYLFCKWILAHPVAHARGHRILPELPYPPYSVLFKCPGNGLTAFKFVREFASNEDKRFGGHWSIFLDFFLP